MESKVKQMKQRKKSKFTFIPFSRKQKQVLNWWTEDSPHRGNDAIICDGAVRTGKTVIMSMSFVIWAMDTFNASKLGMAGKTIGSFRRNVLFTLKIILRLRGYKVIDHRSDNTITVSKGAVENYFHIFGGKDEKSQDLVQGFTSAGFFFDEVALMPQSFVQQAVARCSEEGRKLWFNCNPDGPFHWFKKEWIDDLVGKNAFRIHFVLKDNPSLSKATIEFYERMFTGIFYDRFILGLWVMAEGVIYSMFNHRSMVVKELPKGVSIIKKWVGIDYGQSNATVYLLVGLGSNEKIYIMDEFYHEGRTEHVQLSPSKYAKAYRKWLIKNGVDGVQVRHEYAYCDPSAKGFMLQLHEEGIRNIRAANNEVIKGIELISSIMDVDMFRIFAHCKKTLAELSAYRWDVKAQEKGEDKPCKENDHAMDAFRYVCNGQRMLLQRLIISKLKKVV